MIGRTKIIWGGVLCLIGALLALQNAQAEAEINPARVKELAAMLAPKPAAFGPPITDRAAWEKLARSGNVTAIFTNAESMAKQKSPALPDRLYLDYSRTGNRERCERVLFERDHRLATFALAECLENRGRFLPALEETIQAICAERAWHYPAHDVKLDNFYGRAQTFDLRSTKLGWELASTDALLGDKLAKSTRRLIRENVSRRLLQPFRAMAEGRQPEVRQLRVRGNHNSVDLAGIIGSALTLVEAPEERAWFIAAGQYYITNYLAGFTRDGYCSEGLGYWNYGFGHYVMLTEAIRRATGNRVDLLADPAAAQPAWFGERVEVLDGVYPCIADAGPGEGPDPLLLSYMANRLGLPATGVNPAISVADADGINRATMYAFPYEPIPRMQSAAANTDSPLRTWFPDGGLLICRPDPASKVRFAAVLKGGHNAEQHNHNDVGSFSVVADKTTVLCDPGAEVYTSRTFSARRYESKVLSSYGHSLPMLDGKLQSYGSDARAVVLRTDFQAAADTLTFDLRSAYAVRELQQFERTFTFTRGDAMALKVVDTVKFSTPKTFETALITWSKWKKVGPNELRFGTGADAVRVKIDTGGVPFKIHAEILDENVVAPQKPLRLGIALKSPVREAVVTFHIMPE